VTTGTNKVGWLKSTFHLTTLEKKANAVESLSKLQTRPL
jgi:hypothetical protein